MSDQAPGDAGLTMDPAAAQRLYTSGLVALIVTCAWLLWRSSDNLSLGTFFGLGILILASMPALSWARKRHTWFPAFEISCLTCIAFYAVPLLLGHTELASFRPEAVANGAGLVLVYLAMANLGFAIVRNPVRPSPWALKPLIPEGIDRYILGGVFITTIYLYLQNFTTLMPKNLEGSFRALFYGVGTICTFVLSRQWGLRRLPRNIVGWFGANLCLQLIMMVAQLYLIGGISLLILACVAYASARRRIPWLVLVVAFPILAILHQGKSSMRDTYWAQGAPPPTITQLPAFFADWVQRGLERQHEDDQAQRRASIFERASLIQMICLSVDRVPSLKPHLDGESYVDIPALIIPRFLWPEKPSSLYANVRLALYFDLVSIETALNVSIAFGMIAEAYVNFGFLGVALLGLLYGMGLKRIAMLSQGAPQFSALGILMILLTAWSFQVEFVLATWLISLFQAAVVCIGLPLVWNRFTHA